MSYHGLTLSPVPAEAEAAFDRASLAVLAYGRDSLDQLAAALAAAPHFVATHALHGLLHVIAARDETVEVARLSLTAATESAARTLATADEQALLDALAHGVRGKLSEAASVLEGRLAANPDSVLLLKLATQLRFMLGEAGVMLADTKAALVATQGSPALRGFVLGCHAFALEETGDYAAALATGEAALALNPADPWAIHAVAHVYEMTGKPRDGINWVERHRPTWTQANNFAGHVAWHLALYHLELGQHDAVLDVYDREIRPTPSEDVRDLANATAMLWRLRQYGVAVGDRWDELAAIAARREHEVTLLFATLHRMLASAATGDVDTARATCAAIERLAATGLGDQAAIARTVGLPLARALLAIAVDETGVGMSSNGAPARLLPAMLTPLGGSHAQRDVFTRALAELANLHHNPSALAAITTARRHLFRDARFGAVFG